MHPNIKYMFGAVSISGAMPSVAKSLMIYYYDKYYGRYHDMLHPKDEYKIPAKDKEEFDKIFTANDAREDFKVLREQLNYYNVTVPTLYKQYADLCEEGGISFMGYNVDKDFENCIDSFILVDIDKIKDKKRERYIKPEFGGVS